MRYLFIINPLSGVYRKRKRILRLIQKGIANFPEHHIEICMTKYAGHATELSAQAVNDNVDIVVAVGGDGTMNEVARSLVYSNTSLGVLPAGSGNGFSRSLHIPNQTVRALDVIFNPAFKIIDSGLINDIHFFSVAGVGIDADIAHRFRQLRIRGLVSYFYIGIKTFFRYQIQSYKIFLEKKEINSKFLLVAIANTGEYGNGAKIAPDADFSDGLLDICTLGPLSVFEAVQNLKLLFDKKINTIEKYNSYRSAALKIESTESPLILHTDGEPHTGISPLQIKVLPKSLKVCCPVEIPRTSNN